ncbi:hypothetical protein HYX14_02440 [Candidatus Woesearchaeota archaeon]|nr:hypothetical protein [Candidatus Woesearchaeota archaeon]
MKRLLFFLGFVLIVIGLFNTVQLYQIGKTLVEKAQPAVLPKVELALITADSCQDCFDITKVASLIEGANLQVTDKVTLDYSSKTAKALLEKYNIDRVPAIIVKGDVEKARIKLTDLPSVEKNGALILTAPEPPFVDVASGQVKGYVALIQLFKEGCDKCYDLNPLVQKLRQNLKVKEYNTLPISSAEGKKLAEKYNITAVPTLIFSPDAGLYLTVSSAWKNIGTIEKDGYYVMRNLNPPYYNIEKNAVQGLVTLTTITDKSCTNCYDAKTTNKPILEGLGLTLASEQEYDAASSEGKKLIEKYKITQIPTILLTGDLNIYPLMERIWKDVGTIESDGAYVFRKVELFGQTYRDLVQQKVITPSKDAASLT